MSEQSSNLIKWLGLPWWWHPAQPFLSTVVQLLLVQKPARMFTLFARLSEYTAEETTLLLVGHVERLIVASFTVSSLWAQLGALNIAWKLRHRLTSYTAQKEKRLPFVFKETFQMWQEAKVGLHTLHKFSSFSFSTTPKGWWMIENCPLCLSSFYRMMMMMMN